jgi:Na+-transporting methylmalonyl-CoA/oxaloacetate decarboxylase gamma subunit
MFRSELFRRLNTLLLAVVLAVLYGPRIVFDLLILSVVMYGLARFIWYMWPPKAREQDRTP